VDIAAAAEVGIAAAAEVGIAAAEDGRIVGDDHQPDEVVVGHKRAKFGRQQEYYDLVVGFGYKSRDSEGEKVDSAVAFKQTLATNK